MRVEKCARLSRGKLYVHVRPAERGLTTHWEGRTADLRLWNGKDLRRNQREHDLEDGISRRWRQVFSA